MYKVVGSHYYIFWLGFSSHESLALGTGIFNIFCKEIPLAISHCDLWGKIESLFTVHVSYFSHDQMCMMRGRA